jgi:hypothetical protein
VGGEARVKWAASMFLREPLDRRLVRRTVEDLAPRLSEVRAQESVVAEQRSPSVAEMFLKIYPKIATVSEYTLRTSTQRC